jgi:ABC-type phosphate transport system substrate-binding protein
MNKMKLLMGASALVAAVAAMTGSAQAQTQVFGGGSTLIGPYLVQAENCFYGPSGGAPLVNQGAYGTNPTPYATGETFTAISAFVYKGTPTCAPNTSAQLNFIGSGSGNGFLSVTTHDINEDVGTTTDGSFPNSVQFTSIQYGAGDYGVGAGDVDPTTGVYVNGGTLSQKEGDNATKPVILAQSANQSTATPPTSYPNPYLLYGNFIQFPISIDPVAVAFSPIYRVSTSSVGAVTQYKFNIAKPNKDGSGGLLLDMPTVCAIFNGKITNWNDPALTLLNGKKSLQDPAEAATGVKFSVPIELVGRSDSSGTTSIFFRALAAQCGGGTSGTGSITYTEPTVPVETITYNGGYTTAGGKTLPTALLNNGGVGTGVYNPATATNNGPGSGVIPVAGAFTTAKGSTAVAQYVTTSYTPPAGQSWTNGRIAYIGTDYVLPNSINTGLAYQLFVANIKPAAVGATAYLEPTAANALKAFGAGTTAILPPQSTAAGAYTTTLIAANSHGHRSAPQDWAEPISTTITYSDGTNGATPLAAPIKTAYPLVGTTQMFLNTCLANSTVTADLVSFLKNYTSSAGAGAIINSTSALKLGILESAGLAPLPAAWRTAILQTFVVPTTKNGSPTSGVLATNALNLNLATGLTGTAGATGGQCATIPGA